MRAYAYPADCAGRLVSSTQAILHMLLPWRLSAGTVLMNVSLSHREQTDNTCYIVSATNRNDCHFICVMICWTRFVLTTSRNSTDRFSVSSVWYQPMLEDQQKVSERSGMRWQAQRNASSSLDVQTCPRDVTQSTSKTKKSSYSRMPHVQHFVLDRFGGRTFTFDPTCKRTKVRKKVLNWCTGRPSRETLSWPDEATGGASDHIRGRLSVHATGEARGMCRLALWMSMKCIDM